MDQKQFRQELEQNERLLAFFSSPNCTVCQAMFPKVEALVDEYGDWTLLKVSSAESTAVAGQLLVFTAPTLVFFVDGREVERLSRNFAMQDVRQRLNRN